MSIAKLFDSNMAASFPMTKFITYFLQWRSQKNGLGWLFSLGVAIFLHFAENHYFFTS